MLYILHLEPLEERYTKQWLRWFDTACNARDIAYMFVPGRALTETVESGLVLDVEGTNFWKFTQLRHVCEMFKRKEIKDGDVFFTMDVWHPGLEAIRYMAQLEKIKVGIYGFLHAGSYTDGDFCGPMASWAQHFERGWVGMCDEIFVGSMFHKNDFARKRLRYTGMEDKVRVTGNPFSSSDILRECDVVPESIYSREKVIVFSHRWDKEKRPDVAIDILNGLYAVRQDFKVVLTSGRIKQAMPELESGTAKFPYRVRWGLSKKDYYQQLAKSRIVFSTAEAENFGYCVTEAMVLGCTPVLPNRLSYPEIVDNMEYLYNTTTEAITMLSRCLDQPVNFAASASKYDGATDKILSAMGY